MMEEKIAVVVDSGSDVSVNLREGLDIISLPLRVSIDGKEYTDGKDITSKEVLSVLDKSKVTTSLPSGEDIIAGFEMLKSKGYTHIIAVSISSGLSGTYNVLRNLSEEVSGVEIHIIDSKNISLGSGFLGIHAAECVKKGMSFADTIAEVESLKSRSKVFFTVGTLDYLVRGGRIGLVAGTVANVLNIKPIISCNDDGVYHTVTKVRGYSRVIQKMIDTAANFVADSESYKVVIVNADSKEDLEKIKAIALEKMPNAGSIEVANITPALAIHTGPEALGIAVIKN